jgi:murein DD-endopeptidase MepM/ murein hydrolase activator NlpD
LTGDEDRLLQSVSLPESRRGGAQRATVWVASIVALAALSRTLVTDLNIRLDEVAPAPPAVSTGLLLPASGIVPHIPPPPPPKPRETIEDLIIPVEGIKPSELIRTFNAPRSGGRAHRALDILARRNTPVLAASDGKIVNLSTNPFGGTTIYQIDPTGRYAYYYAHLQRYAKGLREGNQVKKGQVIGYVGTTGNAPAHVPHLHFAVYRLKTEGVWRSGKPLDPYDLLVR